MELIKQHGSFGSHAFNHLSDIEINIEGEKVRSGGRGIRGIRCKRRF